MNEIVPSAEHWIWVSIFSAVSTLITMAQSLNPAASPGNDFLRRQAGETLEQRLDALEESTPDVKQVIPSIPEVEPKRVLSRGHALKSTM